MKLLFSEAQSDYNNYIFPYAIWAIPQAGEKPSQIFSKGFLPAARDFKQFYMCRQIRINLQKFERSSENRRILRKCEGIEYRLVPQEKFDFTPAWRKFCKNYADIKFGKNIMTYQRLDSLMESKLVTHLLVFHDAETDDDIGLVTLYIEGDQLAYFYYSFYDLNYYNRNLGMYIMTSAVDFFASEKTHYIYLGSCYSRNALYKTQFSGAEFFNGFRWSSNLKELKYLIQHDSNPAKAHVIETPEFREKFYDGKLTTIVDQSNFVIILE